MIDQEQRRLLFIEAQDLLGGGRAVARILGVSDRTVRYLAAGELTLTKGFMRDITHALRTRGDACRALAAKTDPLFTANLTAAEIKSLPSPQEARRAGRTEARRG